MQEVIKKVAAKLGLPEQLVEKVDKAYWLFIRSTISSLPLKEDLKKEEFDKLRTNFNLPSLGKLVCTYDKYERVKKADKLRVKNNGEYNDYKKDKTSF